MALSDIGLCSRALVRIGAAPITGFDDGSAESEIAGTLYAQARDALLSAYAWSFASGQVVLDQLLAEPVADYAHAYQLPNDFLRALSAGSGARGRGLNYRIAAGALHTNAGDNDQALIMRLSAEFTIPVTENTSRAEAMFGMAEKEFQRARQIDAQQDTPGRIEDFTLIDVRD